MCPPSDQNPAELDQVDATTAFLPDSGPISPKMPVQDGADGNTNSTVESDAAQDGLPPTTKETEAAVITSGIGGLATIHEQSDSVSPDDESGGGDTTSDKNPPEKIAEKETSEPADIPSLPKSDSAMDQVGGNEPARLALRPEGGLIRTAVPETASTTIVASAGTTGDFEQESAHTPRSMSPATDSAEPDEHKFVDPNDKDNIGNDVIKFFYTASTRKRASSPVTTAPGCCNPRLHRDSDLYVKAKGEDGKVYVFEVVSSTLEKASTKFEAMIYGSHTRGNKEEWVWEVDDNP